MIALRLRRAAHLGRSHGGALGHTAAQRTVRFAQLLMGVAVSLAAILALFVLLWPVSAVILPLAILILFDRLLPPP